MPRTSPYSQREAEVAAAMQVSGAPVTIGGYPVTPGVKSVADALGGLIRYPADYAAGRATGDPVEWATNMGLSMMGGGSAFPAAASDLRMGIKAYHGSPYDFEKFDVSKIGTGEGNQFYGHGLYFAEQPKVAETYRGAGNGRVEITTPEGRKPLDYDTWHDTLPDILKGIDPTIPIGASSKIKAAVYESTKTPGTTPLQAFDAMVNGQLAKWEANGVAPHIIQFEKLSNDKAREALKQLDPAYVNTGKTYEVSINAHPDEFLDWDKPLSQQTPQVQAAMAKAGLVPPAFNDLSYLEKMAAADPNSWHAQQLDYVKGLVAKPMSEFAPKTAESAQALRAAGIKGIRYADQGSRDHMYRIDYGNDQGYALHHDYAAAKKELDEIKPNFPDATLSETGTRNYVVFDDKTVEILKKYGLAGLTALGAGAGYAANQPLQSTTGQTIPAGTPIY